MSKLVCLLLLITTFGFAQSKVNGRVIDSETSEPLAYARISLKNDTVLTNIDGSFELLVGKEVVEVRISYVGYETISTRINEDTKYLQIKLSAVREKLQTVELSNAPNPADSLISEAISRKELNDPEEVLPGFKYKSYSKFIVDNEGGGIQLYADSTSAAMKTIVNEGRGYLSEKVASHSFDGNGDTSEEVLGVRTAGFEKPVYNVLTMEVNPFSLYKNDYSLYKTDYAGPLGKAAFRNYDYKILDTTQTSRPAYVIYFSPKREEVVAGLEGILYLDTETLAIQKAKAQLLGSVKLEVDYEYQYFPDHSVWFPKLQTTTIKPGSGGKEIAVFGGTVGIGTIQQNPGILSRLLGADEISRDLYLNSTVIHYDFDLQPQAQVKTSDAEIKIDPDAIDRTQSFWEENRKVEYDDRDEATEQKVDSLIKSQNIERKIQVKQAIASGSYPLGFWDIDLGKIFKFSNYEGIRLGFGGKTNDQFSENFNLNSYLTYGFKDEVFKYGLGSQIYLNKVNHTYVNFGFSRDIDEIASVDYLKGRNTFSILEPRFVNTNNYYNIRTFAVGLEHKITPRLDTQLRFSREEIWQIKNYNYNDNNQLYSDYDLHFIKAGFLWQPFSKYLRTPQGDVLLEKKFPQFTGQLEQAMKILDGNFNFTRIGIKAEHEILRLDQSRTEFILEGNYAVGDLPLTHAFHSYPNNPNRSRISQRISVAGRNSFETMYFNEFYSDRLVMLHMRHQLRPFNISKGFRPELVFISRHAIGDFSHIAKHEGITFNTLENGFSEAGLELNKLFGGFGLSTAYRYGAYHLPTFKENFSLKFTLQVQL
ncbi:DUF5686 family protein [Christiangramia sp. OXR-203]|jgi:hypothetical protein|uniref:DUF5686 family protein n=1 Tax=Christiangramia sp. OXR-203 TaxID=3100176 RepID=UPI002AC8D55E|nr:DUF5686 family protein [Christiangramia sp. OXR-203]WPY98307.1 DUF5686 family protein [Christiangramia sp. OXR-203]